MLYVTLVYRKMLLGVTTVTTNTDITFTNDNRITYTAYREEDGAHNRSLRDTTNSLYPTMNRSRVLPYR